MRLCLAIALFYSFSVFAAEFVGYFVPVNDWVFHTDKSKDAEAVIGALYLTYDLEKKTGEVEIIPLTKSKVIEKQKVKVSVASETENEFTFEGKIKFCSPKCEEKKIAGQINIMAATHPGSRFEVISEPDVYDFNVFSDWAEINHVLFYTALAEWNGPLREKPFEFRVTLAIYPSVLNYRESPRGADSFDEAIEFTPISEKPETNLKKNPFFSKVFPITHEGKLAELARKRAVTREDAIQVLARNLKIDFSFREEKTDKTIAKHIAENADRYVREMQVIVDPTAIKKIEIITHKEFENQKPGKLATLVRTQGFFFSVKERKGQKNLPEVEVLKQ